METSNTILVELQNFLLMEKMDTPTTLKVHQKLNAEACELLKDMQEYAHLVGFYNIDLKAHPALEKRLKREGLQFERLISTESDIYLQTKENILPFLEKRYDVSCYIDETEDSPWHQMSNLHRLKF